MKELTRTSAPSNGLAGIAGGGIAPVNNRGEIGSGKSENLKGPSFQETLKKIDQGGLEKSIAGLKPELNKNTQSTIKFSNHAVERMQTRGVRFSPEDIKKLESAVQKAASKGAKDSLVLMNDTALIVSVKNNTVVTVVDKNSLKENVFTNIDSTVVI